MNVRRAVRLTLHDGATLTIAWDDVSRVCDNLWRFANPDAVALACVLIAETRGFSTQLPLELTAAQSALIRQAVGRSEAA